MKKKPTVWLARNSARNTLYVLSEDSLCLIDGFWEDKDYNELAICPDRFDKIAPKSCHLKPGEGPIEIDITIGRKK